MDITIYVIIFIVGFIFGCITVKSYENIEE